MKYVAKAASQANRKALTIAKHPQAAARALGIAENRAAALRIVPLVVLNQGFCVSCEIDGCRVLDARFLSLYLGSGTYSPNAVVGPRATGYVIGSATLCLSQAEAAERLESMLRDPPTLRRFVDRLAWDAYEFPTASGIPLTIERTLLGEVGERERLAANRLRAAAGL